MLSEMDATSSDAGSDPGFARVRVVVVLKERVGARAVAMSGACLVACGVAVVAP